MLCLEYEGYNDNQFSRYVFSDSQQASRDFYSLRALAWARTRAWK